MLDDKVVQVTDILYRNFNERLKCMGIKKATYARDVGISGDWLRRTIRNKSDKIQLRVIVQMADYLGCSVADLLTEDPEDESK